MRKLALTVALAATCTLAAPLVQPAEAGVIKPAGVGAALDDVRLAEPVHCRPGWWHHRRGDGCFRRAYRSYRSYGYYDPYPRPYAYGYAPGISLHFNVGPRRHYYRRW